MPGAEAVLNDRVGARRARGFEAGASKRNIVKPRLRSDDMRT